jgi:predicted TPR repeat methyltransferase
MAAPNTTGSNFLARAYNLRDAEDCKKLYDDWAASYDKDLADPSQDYVAPTLVTRAVVAAGGNMDGHALDAGCGTGLCGIALSQAGAKKIDGVDLSEAMLKVAGKTGVYQNLAPADLSVPLEKPDKEYDVVTCVGTLTKTHVGPVPAIKEFVRVTKNGGIIAATVLDDIWESGGYRAEIDRLIGENAIEVVSKDLADYRKGADVKARILVLRKQ